MLSSFAVFFMPPMLCLEPKAWFLQESLGFSLKGFFALPFLSLFLDAFSSSESAEAFPKLPCQVLLSSTVLVLNCLFRSMISSLK